MKNFSAFQRAVEQRWNGEQLKLAAQGQRILGYLDTEFPEELAIAAGLLPVLLTGDPQGKFEATRGHVDLGIPGRARQLYEGFLTDRYDFADVVVITGGDRYLANTYGFLKGYHSLNEGGTKATLFYLEHVRGTYREHRNFNRDRLALLRTALGEFSGQEITDEALAHAIKLVNRTRALLQELTELRISQPGIISGVQAATIALASRLMPKPEFNEQLSAYLDESRAKTTPLEGRRVYLTGSPIDHLEVHAAIEAAGYTVIGDDVEFAGGIDYLQVRDDLEPLEAIADRYTFRYPARWAFGRERRISWNARNILQAKADQVLFYHAHHDSGAGWDYPDLRNALQHEDLRIISVQDQPYLLGDKAELNQQIAQALEVATAAG